MADEPHWQVESIEENLLDPDEGNHMLCKACALPIFSTPLYNENTDFPLHKDCANLPIELKHIRHPREPLVLLKESSSRGGNIKCYNCSKQCKGFIYQCPDSKCRITLDVLCAVPIGTIKILHKSHVHELVPFPVNSLVSCRACESIHHGPSYLCKACEFWIHWDCALLPNTIQHKKHDSEHLLTLSYSPDISPIFGFMCSICERQVTSSGRYICGRCEDVAHIKCATSDPESFSPVLKGHMGDSSLVHLPMVDEKTSLIRYLLENTTSNSSKEKDSIHHAEKFFDGKHEHPLIYHDHASVNDDHKYQLCNGCVKPISPPFYSCPQCGDFFLHSCCANLPLEFHPAFSGSLLPVVDLRPKTEDFFSKFTCDVCARDCNGFVYAGEKSYMFLIIGNIMMDVECAFLPNSITHEAHPKSHILFKREYGPSFVCQCCGLYRSSPGYACSSCRHFQLHVRCAMLPVTVIHKFDKHPLKLIFTISKSNLPARAEDDDYFCEICEQSINTNCWFYGCGDCSNWFHIYCIPSVSRFSNIKFGGKIRVQCHDCPLTSIRLLTEYSRRCGICQKTIQGFVDEIAFECAKCNFRVHYDCAKEQWGDGLEVDSELEDQDDLEN